MKPIKKLILSFAILVMTAISVFTNISSNVVVNSNIDYTQAIECKYDQCHATAKSTGNRCKHCVSNEGDLYCWQHD